MSNIPCYSINGVNRNSENPDNEIFNFLKKDPHNCIFAIGNEKFYCYERQKLALYLKNNKDKSTDKSVCLYNLRIEDNLTIKISRDTVAKIFNTDYYKNGNKNIQFIPLYKSGKYYKVDNNKCMSKEELRNRIDNLNKTSSLSKFGEKIKSGTVKFFDRVSPRNLGPKVRAEKNESTFITKPYRTGPTRIKVPINKDFPDFGKIPEIFPEIDEIYEIEVIKNLINILHKEYNENVNKIKNIEKELFTREKYPNGILPALYKVQMRKNPTAEKLFRRNKKIKEEIEFLEAEITLLQLEMEN